MTHPTTHRRQSALLNVGALLLMTAALTGCALSSHQAQTTSMGRAVSGDQMVALASQPGQVRLTRVVAADWAVDRAGLINLDHPEAQAAGLEDGLEDIQIYFYALEHPTHGPFMIDTGVARVFETPDEAPVSWLVAAAMNTDALHIHTDTARWLEDKSLAGVLMTHLHLDHVMGLPDIPKDVPIYTGPGESQDSSFKNMFVQGTTDRLLDGFGALQQWSFEADPSGRFEGVLDLFGDGQVFAIHAPGHTPGSTAYLVRTPTGPELIVGDASHTDWGWSHGVEPGSFSVDVPQSARSLAQLRALEQALPGLTVHLGHQHHGQTHALHIH